MPRTRTPSSDRPSDGASAATATTAMTALADAPLPLSDLPGLTEQVTAETAAPARPTMLPPSLRRAGMAEAVAAGETYHTDKRIGLLWTNRSARNAWMHVDGLGWRKLAPSTDASVVAMTQIASLARQTGARVDFGEGSDGLVRQIVIW